MLRAKAETILIDIICNRIDGWDARQNTVFEAAKRGRELVATGRRNCMTEESFYGDNRPVLKLKRFGHLVKDLRFRNSILRRARAMCQDHALVSHCIFADHGARRSDRFCHTDMIAGSRRRDRLFRAICINKDISDCAKTWRAEFARERIIH